MNRNLLNKATASSTTSKKKTLKGTFHGSAGGSFFQKKKVVFSNVKHSGNKKNISLSKSGSDDSVYSNVESLSGEDEDISMSKTNSGSLLGSAATILKAKIIRSIFTSEKSIEIAASLARKKEINVNSNLKKQGVHSNWAVVIKEIPMDMPKEMIIAVLAKFGKIKSIKIQLIGLWQKAVVEFAELGQAKHLAAKWSFLIGKDSVALLFTLPVGTTAHDLGTLLEGIGGKTCIINRSLDSGNRICCVVVGFESKNAMESAYHTEPIFNGVKLSWARLDLVCCEKCGLFGHSALECDAPSLSIAKSLKIVKRVTSKDCYLQLVKLYAKKSVPISRPAAFDGKSWTQVVSLTSPFGNLYFNSSARSDSSPPGFSGFKRNTPVVQSKSSINDHLASLECSLELLADQVSDIMRRFNGVELVLLVLITQVVLPATPVPTLVSQDTDMVLNVLWPFFPLSFSVLEDKVADLGLSSSKVLTSKVGGLESKIMALEIFIGSILEKFFDALFASMSELIWRVATCNIRGIKNLAKQENIVHWHKDSRNMISIVTETKLRSDIRSWIMNKFDGLQVFTSGLDVGFHGAEVAIIMNNFLAWHVSKVDEIPGHLISVCLLFKNKLSVMILGLYTGVFISTQFSQAADINSMVSKVVNSSFFVVLGGDFNENGSSKSANNVQWLSFKNCSSAKFLARLDMFEEARVNGNLNTMWKLLEKTIVQTADTVWLVVNAVEASKVNSMIWNSVSSMELIKHLSVIKKRYCKSKYYESKIAEDTAIKKTIDYCMENFCFDKEKMIKSILERLFCKVVLDHLIVDNELVVEPNKVKLKIDKIMEE
ncbi:hypothetical protein G9A89_017164 [Geosiphon pyriformis]|nr:hypothetical protein G9A89_017164 [Geosiphon pyriformis]